ncbi:phosphoribosyltransferase [Treponema phagedenis]|uniref:Phosphoribosyltransferase n=1 Tax=Treponema phagedenis TaxID=162 RepID=A0AAE6IVY5_TREPH|nr:phosphoribosyltransferase [Treponema phagedenis]NVP24281.1 phosphoribosyltransferase [Treponema phagedenis]QEJ94251.1 phosphoribosyltransferase [Treponema phagedenis]QEJ99123.1 phosphoribosyltransferase [Treponema phagedenis]QEK00209.1 phosphoribosyltransferase [Treponema phagedenis]QEK04651.1 phosphoribosyltransferase [Treponema phagedenis]
MIKDFISYDNIRNNGFKLAQQIIGDKFIPNVIYVSLRGGAYLGNVISEYFKVAFRGKQPILYAAVVVRFYSNVQVQDKISIDGWTLPPENLRKGTKILLVDDIFDSGITINYLVDTLIEKGIPRRDIKIAVHDYKIFHYKKPEPIQPDYWCRKHDIHSEADDLWIHYMSHELMGLSEEELEKHYYAKNPELRDVFKPLQGLF